MVCYKFSGCPDGSQPVNCLIDPCQVTPPPYCVYSRCEANYCGGCNRRYFDFFGHEVCQSKGKHLQFNYHFLYVMKQLSPPQLPKKNYLIQAVAVWARNGTLGTIWEGCGSAVDANRDALLLTCLRKPLTRLGAVSLFCNAKKKIIFFPLISYFSLSPSPSLVLLLLSCVLSLPWSQMFVKQLFVHCSRQAFWSAVAEEHLWLHSLTHTFCNNNFKIGVSDKLYC